MWTLFMLAASVALSSISSPATPLQPVALTLEKRCFFVKETGQRVSTMLEKGVTLTPLIRRTAVTGYWLNKDGTSRIESNIPTRAEEHHIEVSCA